MVVVLYEDSFYLNFVPFYTFHNVFDLYYGFKRIYEKIFDIMKLNKNIEKVSFIGRKKQLEYFLKSKNIKNEVFDYSNDILFINARINDINKAFLLKQREFISDDYGFIMALRVDKEIKKEIDYKKLFSNEINIENISNKFVNIGVVDSLKYAFDLIKNIKVEFLNDFERNYKSIKTKFKKYKKDIYIGKNVKMQKFVELDSSIGPIIISNNCIINSFSNLVGPLFIGENSLIDDAYIRENSVIGKTCKISGEIEESYIMDYTNKHHTGFVGHSYLGEWVNLGAMTTTSDLKNNYSNIKFYINNKTIDSGTIKMGVLLGDHVKTAIGVMINCGTIIGEGSVIFKSPSGKFIKPFLWGEEEYKKDLFIENLKKIVKRRNFNLIEEYIHLIL